MLALRVERDGFCGGSSGSQVVSSSILVVFLTDTSTSLSTLFGMLTHSPDILVPVLRPSVEDFTVLRLSSFEFDLDSILGRRGTRTVVPKILASFPRSVE